MSLISVSAPQIFNNIVVNIKIFVNVKLIQQNNSKSSQKSFIMNIAYFFYHYTCSFVHFFIKMHFICVILRLSPLNKWN